MINRELFRGKKISVIGLARSGEACAKLLNSFGAEVFVSDINNSAKFRKIAAYLKKLGIVFELGKHTKGFIKGSHLVILSPGVPNDSKVVKFVKSLKIPVISEIELGFRLCPAPIIAVTGTNGKTTVTTLIGEILKKKKRRVFVLGNIGTPFCSKVSEVKKDDLVVLEISSFQLEYIDKFKPKVAVALNFSPDHMDRYKNEQEYFLAKKRVLINQDKNDYTVLNFDDKIVRSLAKSTSAKVLYFGNKGQGRRSLNHNFLAAQVVGKIFGVAQKDIHSVFDKFKGVEHRIEFVRSIGGVDYINDSKATNINSTMWAFSNISKPIILIAGGSDKGADFSIARDVVKSRAKLLIVLGETKDKILGTFDNLLPTRRAKDLMDAVLIAKNNAKSGDCILLSPMCASFDMFENYEHRGRIFKQVVKSL